MGPRRGPLVLAVLLIGAFFLATRVDVFRAALLAPVQAVLALAEPYGYSGMFLQSEGSGGGSAPATGGGGRGSGPRGPGGGGGATALGGGSGAATGTGEGPRRESSLEAVPTATMLTLSAARTTHGRLVRFTAEVRASRGVPSGTVRFVLNGVVASSQSLEGAEGYARASYSTSSLRVGAYDAIARYEGSLGFKESRSLPSQLLVYPAPAARP
jgi:hypothetical protein